MRLRVGEACGREGAGGVRVEETQAAGNCGQPHIATEQEPLAACIEQDMKVLRLRRERPQVTPCLGGLITTNRERE